MKSIAVIIPAFKAEAFLGESLDSVLSQKTPEGIVVEVLVGIDACPSSRDAALAYVAACHDRRLRLFYAAENVGAYVVRNALARKTTADVLVFHDADDVMLPGHLAEIAEGFERLPAIDVVRNRWLLDGPNPRIVPGFGEGHFAISRASFELAGGFAPWRVAGDTEFRLRGNAFGFSTLQLATPGFVYRQHAAQATRAIPGAKGDERARRRAEIKERAEKWEGGEVVEPESFAVVDLDPLEWAWSSLAPVHVCLCSFPPRAASLRETLRSLLAQLPSNGCVHVYLNDYADGEIPPECFDPRVDCVRSQDAVGDLGDVGKFYFVGHVEGYYLTVDDDFVYPRDYVERVVEAIEARGRRAAVGFHGVVFNPEGTTTHGQRDKFYPVLSNQPAPQWVNMLGTGVLGFHTSAILLSLEAFPVRNMADVWFALTAKRQGVPLCCLAHVKTWLTLCPSCDQAVSIWQSSAKRDGTPRNTAQVQIETIAACAPWPVIGTNERGETFVVYRVDRRDPAAPKTAATPAPEAPPATTKTGAPAARLPRFSLRVGGERARGQ